MISRKFFKLDSFWAGCFMMIINFYFAAIFAGNLLTDCPCVRQTKAKSAKSRIFVKVGWFDPSMGGIDQPQYFCPGAHPNGRGSPP